MDVEKECETCLYFGIFTDGVCGFTDETGEICEDKSGYEKNKKGE